jgi:glycosyltransferase involved in cell wall biosynthesis
MNWIEKSEKPLVTIVIATKGSNPEFQRALISVWKQTYRKVEIVVVYEKFPPVPIVTDSQIACLRFYQQQEKGIYENFNYGIQLADGDYVCFLNDDDWYEPEFVESSLKNIEKNSADGSYSSSVIHLRKGKSCFVEAKENLKNNLLLDFIGAYHTTFMISRDVFQKVGCFLVENYDGSRLKYASDYDWFIRALNHQFRFIKNKETSGHFSMGGASTQHRLELIAEAECISAHHAKSFGQKTVVKTIWKLRYLMNYLKK